MLRYMTRNCLAALVIIQCASAQFGGELTFALRGEPKNLDPFEAVDEPSELVRYLTKAPLIRINRKTQQLEGQLAESWKVSPDGRRVDFVLRAGVKFSDGSAFDAEDVAYTFKRLMAMENASPIADALRTQKGPATVEVRDSRRVSLIFPQPIAGVERLFDPVPILASEGSATLGPFVRSEYKPGQHVLLKRNPYYWKKDASGKSLPYLDSVRLQIQKNPQLEQLRFRRGQYHLMNGLEPDAFARLAKSDPDQVRDAGPSLDVEFLWFNQTPTAPIEPFRRAWFESKEFRRAVSMAIKREDLVRVAYQGYATPALGPISPANRYWFNPALRDNTGSPARAAELLRGAGFTRSGDQLLGPKGHSVEFSLVTNAGNKTRERIASMIQQDLAALGVKLNIVALDFQSLIERIVQSYNYEACLLGFVNVDLDPNAQQGVWLSSGRNHAWNPAQDSPTTEWEARIDELILAQASTTDPEARRESFHEVQRIVQEQSPIVYLAHKNALSAVSPQVRNVDPGVLWPHLIWNIEELFLGSEVSWGR